MKRAAVGLLRSKQIRDDIEDVTRFLIQAAKMNAVDGTYDAAACRLLEGKDIFAAAPDLLAALDGLTTALQSGDELDERRWFARARDAIAKARGES